MAKKTAETTDPTTAPYTLITLEAQNVKKLKAVRLRLEGQSLVLVGGENEQGKSSLLDSVAMLLGGGKEIPPEPVRRGAKSATIVGKIGPLTITRKIRPNRSTSLEVLDESGKVSTPQKFLDELVGSIALDPLEFATMDEQKQDRTLKALVKLDTSEVDKREQEARDDRTDVNRDLKRAQAVLDEMPEHPEAPSDLVSVEALTDQMEAAETEIERQSEIREALEGFDGETDVLCVSLTSKREEIGRLEERLDSLRSSEVELGGKLEQRTSERAELAAVVDELKEPDTDAIRQQLRDSESTNALIRQNQARDAQQDTVDALRSKAEAYTYTIEDCQEKRAAAMAAVKYPVDGLSFAEGGGVLVDGLPWEQASQARRLKVSVAIGFALNPKIRVLLAREGHRLDDANLALVGQMAKDAGGQLIVERVGKTDEGAIIIEDGSKVSA